MKDDLELFEIVQPVVELTDSDLEEIVAGKGTNNRDRSINQSVNIGGRRR